MSLFGNQNFMIQIAKEIGCPHLSEDTAAMMQLLVEIQTRKLIQQAAKFMYSDRRDEIIFDDLKMALSDMDHEDITLVSQEQEYTRDGSSFVRRDPIYKSGKELLEEEFKYLSMGLSTPSKLRSRWIYIDGKIPRTNDNKSLKSKAEILSIRQKELGEKNKKFNIIMDQPESMLTGYELQYYRQVTALLSEGDDNISKLSDIDVTGNLSNLFPLFLKFLIGSDLTDIKMIYFMSLLSNKYIEKSAEYHLHQILTYLWSYEGYLCLKVGQLLGSYIRQFGQKYPFLYTIWIESMEQEGLANQEYRTTAYYNTIKRIGIELTTGIKIQIKKELIAEIQGDCSKGSKGAQLCKQTIIEYSGVVECLRSSSSSDNYWIPSEEGEAEVDMYMMMNL